MGIKGEGKEKVERGVGVYEIRCGYAVALGTR